MRDSECRDRWWRSVYEDDVWGEPPWYILVLIRLNLFVMVTMVRIAEWLRYHHLIRSPAPEERQQLKEFVALDDPFVSVYVNNMFRLCSDVCCRPLAGAPNAVMKLKERVTSDYGWTYEMTGAVQEAINVGSYNYLGFSGDGGGCSQDVISTLNTHGAGVCGSRHEFGNSRLHDELDRLMARFLRVDDAICFPMGFCTNSMNISAFVNKECLVLSDQMNHKSLVLGFKHSCAKVVVFQHNDAADMERKLVDSLWSKMSSGGSFKKILIVIEGIYSMEGTIVNLPAFIAVKKRHKAYLFIDEAHSIGALGPEGRGVVEYWGCDPADVDIFMGTFTKSFAAAGGYIAGKKSTIEFVRTFSEGACYGTVMSAPLTTHISRVINVMTGEDGTSLGMAKRKRLLRNSRYLRGCLKQRGFLVFGHNDSPVIPILTFFSTKAVCFGRETLKRGLGVGTVNFPATSWDKSRARLCVSAEHTKEQLDKIVEVLDTVGDIVGVKYGQVRSNPVALDY